MGPPIDMVQLKDISEELRLQIATYLDQNDLCALAVAHRTLTPAARDILYRAPSIPQRDTGARLISLLTAIGSYPELLKKIRSLTIVVVDCEIPHLNSDRKSLDSNLHQNVAPYTDVCMAARHVLLRGLEAAGVPIAWSFFYPDIQHLRGFQLSCAPVHWGSVDETHAIWMNGMKQWHQTAFYTALLTLIPGLEYLSVAVGEQACGQARSTSLLRMPFPWFDKLGPRLKTLKHLNITSGEIAAEWFVVPDLETVQYGLGAHPVETMYTIRDHYMKIPGILPVTRIVMDCSLGILRIYDFESSRLEMFVGRCPALKHVELKLGKVGPYGLLPWRLEHWWSGFNHILFRFAPIEKSIETFKLDMIDRNEIVLLQHLHPMNRLHRYDNLRSLTLPLQSISLENLSLPVNIERLGVLCPNLHVPLLLEVLATQETPYPKLKTIDIYYDTNDVEPLARYLWENLAKADMICRIWVGGALQETP